MNESKLFVQPPYSEYKPLSELAEEGSLELREVLSEIQEEYRHKMESSQEKPRVEKRLLILDCSGMMELGPLTALSDNRLDSSNTDRIDVVNNPEALPDSFDSVAGIVITGSPSDIVEKAEKPWIDQLEAFTQKALDSNIPTLGICFGIQVHADMEKRKVPELWGGREMGVWKTSVYRDATMPEHPIFKGIELQKDLNLDAESAVIETVGAHNYMAGYDSSHRERMYGFHYAESLYRESSPNPENQSDPEPYPQIEINGSYIGLQFHPELSHPLGLRLMKAVAKRRGESLQKAGKDPFKLVAQIEEYGEKIQGSNQVPDNQKFLHNFVDIAFTSKTISE